MIPSSGTQLLLPAKPWFIWMSLIAGLVLNMLQNMGLWGQSTWVPDWLSVVLVFWTVHQPRHVGVMVAFVLGLFVDVHQAGLLGAHALAYSVLSYFTTTLHRRLLWFPLSAQAVQIFPLFALTHGVELVARMVNGDDFPGWLLLLAPCIEAVLWPLCSLILIAPQLRAPDPDANRPL
jgi:rod shape-determining protein MreD